MDTNGMFQPEHVISTYTDREAVEDGILVAITPRDRVSRAVWDWLTAKTPKGSEPPNCWPVDMMGWFRAKTMDDKALAMSKALIGTHRTQAIRTYEENLDGGIYQLFALEHGGYIKSLSATKDAAAKKLWLIPNENQGITLMFPEDY